MPVSIVSAADALCESIAGFDPALFTGDDCLALVEKLAATEKACAGARLLAARRAVECQAYEQRGFSDPADWLAKQSGVTPGEAKRNLKTAGDLGEKTKDALLAGKLSLDQAEEITNTEKEAPGSEADLVDLAPNTDLGRLRDAAREKRLAAVKREELHQRQRAARRFRFAKNWLGMTTGSFDLPPEVGIALKTRIELRAHKLRAAAKQQAKDDPGVEVESWEAYAADALVELLSDTGAGSPRPVQTELVIVCDLRAWIRGETEPGEPCHILEGGPIPVSLARQLADNAFLKGVVHDGVNISHVKHFGRHIPAEIRTALALGEPPGFAGAVCADCGKRHSLEYDHIDPVANNGPTSLDNLQPRCYSDHKAKTERDRKAGLLNPKATSNKTSTTAGTPSGTTPAGPDPPAPP
jgi:hypothetical protein